MLAVELRPSSHEGPIQPSNAGIVLYEGQHSNTELGVTYDEYHQWDGQYSQIFPHANQQ